MPVIVIDRRDANRLKDLFQNAYGNGVRLSSALTTSPLVDGHPWHAQDNKLSLFDELPWLAPIVLSIFAFSGGQSRGVYTKTFAKAIDALRRTRIVWVDTLEAGIWHEKVSVARTSVHALWLTDSNTLLARNETRTEVSKLSEELESIVDRSDISIPLKFVLKHLESTDEISKDIVCESLSQVHITEDQYQEVQQRWLGDFSWKVSLIKPLILLLQPDEDIALLDEVFTEDQFQDVLKSYDIDPLDLDRIMLIARDSSGLKSVGGRQAWEIFGDRAQLSQWNKVLSKLNESPVFNDQATDQFLEHIHSCSTMMHSIIRHTISKNPESRGFKNMEEELINFKCPEDYAKKYWVVDFPLVIKEVCNLFKEWGTGSEVVSSVEDVVSAEELYKQLDRLGLNPNLNSIEIQAENRNMFSRVLEDVQKSALAWCIKENSEVGMWGQDKDTLENFLKDYFAKAAFVDIWDEAKCLQLIGELNRSPIHEGFWTSLDKSSTVIELKDGLGIMDDDLVEVHNQIEERKHKQELQKKRIEVCGAVFVNSEENLHNLWDHIAKAIGDDDLAITDLSILEELEDQQYSKKRRIDGKQLENKKKSKGRISQAEKDLVGLAGEIHAFRALRKHYGIETVGPSSWLSENSRHKYPENTANDSFGCDFKIHKDGKTYFIEVKATKSDAEVFELGPSEVKLAIDYASGRKKEFLILHVLYALSDSPKFRFLPNPYKRKHRNKYRFEEAGLRVRYKTTQ